MSDYSKGSHGQEVVEAKALPARGDFKGVLEVRHGGRNMFVYKTLMLPLTFTQIKLGAEWRA